MKKKQKYLFLKKADKGNFDLEQFGKAYFSESSVKQALIKFTEQRKVNTEIEINGVRFSNISEMLQYMDKQRERIADLEAQIEKMKCCSNCVFLAGCDLSGYEECKNFDKWELREIKEK